MTPMRTNLQERYELREILGRGGMGVVYKALDTLMKREVALKTIIDIDNPASVDLFYKEWSILATMVHPNVIGIYDIGEFEEEGMKKPFFVMPMLPGAALDRLIRDGSPRLTTENVVNIIDQACRGLHAAHEQNAACTSHAGVWRELFRVHASADHMATRFAQVAGDARLFEVTRTAVQLDGVEARLDRALAHGELRERDVGRRHVAVREPPAHRQT